MLSDEIKPTDYNKFKRGKKIEIFLTCILN